MEEETLDNSPAYERKLTNYDSFANNNLQEDLLGENSDFLQDKQNFEEKPQSKMNFFLTKLFFTFHLTNAAFLTKKCSFFLIVIILAISKNIVVIMISLLEIAPAIVYSTLKQKEELVDLQIYSLEGEFFNFNKINKILDKEKHECSPNPSIDCKNINELVVAPRKYLTMHVARDKDPKATEKWNRYRLINGYMPPYDQKAFQRDTVTVKVVYQLFEKESNANFYYSQSMPQISPDEVVLTQAFKSLGYKVGDTIRLLRQEGNEELTIYKYLSTTFRRNHVRYFNLGIFAQDFKIAGFIGKTSERVSFKSSFIAFIDIANSNNQTGKYRQKAFPEQKEINNMIETLPAERFVDQIRIKLGNPKDIYFHLDSYEMSKVFNSKASTALKALGIQDDSATTYIRSRFFEQMLDRSKMTSLLSTTVGAILFFIIALTGYLTSSIFTSIIMDQRRDMATYRAIGISKRHMMLTYLVQTIILSILLILLAEVPIIFLFSYMNEIMFSKLAENFTASINKTGAAFAYFLSVAIPLYSTFVPAYQLFKSNISAELDFNRSSGQGVIVSIKGGAQDTESAEDKAKITKICVVALIFGFAVYVVFPYLILKGDMAWLAFMLISLFSLMGIGVLFVFIQLKSFVENICQAVVLIGQKSYVRSLVDINTKKNKFFNIPTVFIMVGGLTVINVIYLMFTLNTNSTKETLIRSRGNYFSIEGSVPIMDFQLWLSTFKDRHAFEYGYVTLSAESQMTSRFKKVYSRSIGGLDHWNYKLKGVCPHFQNVTAQKFQYYEPLENTSLTPFEYIHTRFASGQVISTFKTNSWVYLVLEYMLDKKSERQPPQVKKVQTLTKAHSLPGTNIHSFEAKKGRQDVLLDMYSYFSLFDDSPQFKLPFMNIANFFMAPREGGLEGYSGPKAEALVDHYHNENPGMRGIQISLYEKPEGKNADSGLQGLQKLIFLGLNITVYGVFLLKFVFTMQKLLLDQKKDIGVMRSLGTSPWEVSKIYFFETFVMILTAAILAFLLSVVMTTFLGLQMELFVDIVYKIELPYQALLSGVFFGFLLSVCSSGQMAYRMSKKQVVKLFRAQ